MNIETLEKILKCPTLPSLPAVAVKVIDLTSNPSVRMEELARTIQNDQGLAAKILRTVNSSFYGLRKPCSTIHSAIVMLGLGPVKTLALGFSLVSAVGKTDDGFDYVAYWRRGLYTAVGARAFAEAAELDHADEAFLGGLLQDVGVMAMYRALGDEYLKVLLEAGGDHRKLVQVELATFEMQHADVGSMLAERWKLPRELVLPVKYHERPTAAPMECGELIRVVAIGNLIHDVLTDKDPTPAMRKLYERSSQWLGLSASQVDQALTRANQGVKELSSVFNLATGPHANIEEILSCAKDQSNLVIRTSAGGGDGANAYEINPMDLDKASGLVGRSGFDKALRDVHAATIDSSQGMGVAYIVIDQMKQRLLEHGKAKCDAAAVDFAERMKSHFGQFGGIACRPTPDVYCVILPRLTSEMVVAVCEGFREQISTLFMPLNEERSGSPLSVSIGISATNGEDFAATDLVRAAALALQSARSSGGNCMRTQNLRLAA